MTELGTQKSAAASIRLDNQEEVKVEGFLNEAGQKQIRFSIWNQDEMVGRSLTLTEKELVALLEAAIQAGILSPDFIEGLQSFIVI